MTTVQKPKHRRSRLRLPSRAAFRFWLAQASYASSLLICGFALGVGWTR